MSDIRFEIRLHPKAAKEHRKLDGSTRTIINRAILQLEVRADEISKRLGNNQHSKLHGCKEVKLADAGVRMVFRIIEDVAEIVEIIVIGDRDDDNVFKEAHKRLDDMKKNDIPLKSISELKGFSKRKE
ncbi:type II toxin-antitoxin system RelE family toxin [Bacillus mycoides]|uniref:type II toxin-antitoxin system RelE family toxin n=1 Tax=Bacillus mycoides TaxID=1405 RepID=UPI0021134CC9|nr:hypothetical protein [Bacillus mycoides]MCQ6530742.1 hypothetical protein [Bacillus mycoides]